MSMRNNKRNISHFTPAPVWIFAKGTGAAAADLTALLGPGCGVASIKYNAATGKLKVTLEDKYNSLLFLAGQIIDPTAVDDWEVQVESEDVAGAKTINIAVFKGGALTDLTTDEKLLLSIIVSNSSKDR